VKYGLEFSLLLLLSSCASAPEPFRFGGDTMGTTYQVTYIPAGSRVDKKAVDDLLFEITQSLSTYEPASKISVINASSDTAAWHPVDHHFEVVFLRSQEIYKDTRGMFNPAVGPLVNAWGFGPDGPQDPPSDTEIQRLLGLTKFEAFELRSSPASLRKTLANARLDFNAIAGGYAVDAVGELLEQAGVKDYVVEIGGEVRVHGRQGKDKPWKVGIERPTLDATATGSLHLVIELSDAGMTTSGNYRDYQTDGNGQRFSHTIDPSTGYPERSALMSVTVIAGDAMTADAYATALLVMGVEEGLRFVESREGIEACFLVSDDKGGFVERRSKGFPSGS
jgi:thiamine biosynthesis lipoprotein